MPCVLAVLLVGAYNAENGVGLLTVVDGGVRHALLLPTRCCSRHAAEARVGLILLVFHAFDVKVQSESAEKKKKIKGNKKG